MKATHVLAHGALALGALTLAYLAWQHPLRNTPPEIRILDLGKGTLSAARFEDQGNSTFVAVAADPAGNAPLVTLSKRKTPGKPETPERLVRGDANAAKLLATLSTLSANRKLGVLPGEKLRALGLVPAKRSLTLTPTAGEARTFELAPSPAGGNEPYLRDPLDGAVYIIGRTILADFDNAPTRLVERHPHAFPLNAIDRILFTAGAKQRTAVVKSDAGKAPSLAFAETPDTADADLKKFHDRLFGVWPIEILGKGETPPGGAPDVVLRIDYFQKDASKGFFELSKGRLSTGKGPSLFARSENLLGYMALPPDLSSLLPEVEKIVR